MTDFNERIAQLREKQSHLMRSDWEIYWDDFAKMYPELDIDNEFELTDDVGNEWIPSFDGDSWSKCCYAFDHGRDEHGLFIRANRGDLDGNWECEDECRGHDFSEFCDLYLKMDSYFMAWADYHLTCAENDGIDPLDEFTDKAPTVERHLEAAKNLLDSIG